MTILHWERRVKCRCTLFKCYLWCNEISIRSGYKSTFSQLSFEKGVTNKGTLLIKFWQLWTNRNQLKHRPSRSDVWPARSRPVRWTRIRGCSTRRQSSAESRWPSSSMPNAQVEHSQRKEGKTKAKQNDMSQDVNEHVTRRCASAHAPNSPLLLPPRARSE